jgi:hypothetical protein
MPGPTKNPEPSKIKVEDPERVAAQRRTNIRKKMLSKSQDEDFERYSRSDLERLAPCDWYHMKLFWDVVLYARPATRRRLLGFGLQRCHDLGVAPPATLVRLIRRELEPVQPRDRVHDPAMMVEAARYSANHPEASLTEIGKAIGMDPVSKNTIKGWMKHPEFQRERNDQLFGREAGKRTVQQKID